VISSRSARTSFRERREDEDVGEPSRALVSTPIYQGRRSLDHPVDLPPRSAAEKLRALLTLGRYVSAEDMVRTCSPAECAVVIGDILRSGFRAEVASNCIRVRVRGEREPRQLLSDVVGLIDWSPGSRSLAPRKVESVSPERPDFDVSSDARAATLHGSDASRGLVLSDPPSGLSLPVGLVGGLTVAVLGMRGSGKTYFGMVMVEEIQKLEDPPAVVVVDPMGVWWGLAATSDGRSRGSCVVLGGQRGRKISAGDGSRLVTGARGVGRSPLVLDLSDMAPAEQHQLVADLCEGLMSGDRFPVHVVVDEADEFAPQKFGAVGGQQRRSLGHLERLVMRGRSRGIGVTVLSLRPAVLSKNVLSQVECLCLGHMQEVNDLRAVRAWLEAFEHRISDRQRLESLSQLPVLPRGTFYFLRGGDDPWFRRFRARRKESYDSSRTLVAGEVDAPILSPPGEPLWTDILEIMGWNHA